MEIALPKIAKEIACHLQEFSQTADLIHNVRIGREGLTYASLLMARKHNIPFILTPVHHPRWVGWRYRAFLELYRKADAVIALTKTEKLTLIQLGVDEDRISVTGHGPILAAQADPDQFLKNYPYINSPFILFLGQHYAYKGYRQVLEAAKTVWENFPEAHFVFVGPSVKKSTSLFDNSDQRIHHLGMVDLQTKTDVLAACTLLCVPSTQESFGGVYTEAWSFAKPVIGCSIPAVSEVIDDGVNGYLVQQNAFEIAERICFLLAHPSRAKKMGKSGMAKVSSKYSWEQLARKTEKAYQMVMARG